jgi:hypothetical protein
VDCLERVLDKEPNNAYYLITYARNSGQLGGKIGLPRGMDYISKCLIYLKKAVDLEPENPEIRIEQMIAYSNLPYQIYPQFKPIIQNDEKIIIKWIDDLNNIYMKNKEAKDTLDKKWGFVTKYSRVNDIYFALGFYYSVQLKDRKTGYEYFSKLHKDSPFFKLAEKIKQDLNKVK